MEENVAEGERSAMRINVITFLEKCLMSHVRINRNHTSNMNNDELLFYYFLFKSNNGMKKVTLE